MLKFGTKLTAEILGCIFLTYPTTMTENRPTRRCQPQVHEDDDGDDDENEERKKMRLRLPSAKVTLEFASKLIKKTIPHAEYWIANRHRWMHNIPTEECDVVVTFVIGIEHTTLIWFLSRFKSIGLNAKLRHNPMLNCYRCYLTAPINVLLSCAEEHHLPKRLNNDYGGGLKEFVKFEWNKFEGFGDEIAAATEFFTSQERQWLILRLLETLRSSNGDEIGSEKFVQGQAIVPKCLSCGIITQIYPVHETTTLKYLRKTWVRSVFNKQPIDDIADYFGVKIAMYFAWLGHYNRALTIPAIVGIVLWMVSFCRVSQSVADIGFVLFSFFNVIWFSVYLEAWKRYCAELAYKWGTIDQRDQLLVEPRPLFSGTFEISPVTGRLEPRYPSWKRNVFRYLITVPLIGVCVGIVVGIMIVSFKLQNWWDKQIYQFGSGYCQCLTFIPKILLGVVISFLDDIYYKIAKWLNDKENYRLDREYENNLIVKVATFQFVNSFISLFYIAFYLQDQQRLKVQLAVLLITRQIIQNIKESALPYLIEQFRLAKLSFDVFGALTPSSLVNEKRKFSDFEKSCSDDEEEKRKSANDDESSSTIPQAEVESTLFKYEGTFTEHLEMFIQLGHVVLFSSAFPMAAFCAFVNNLIEIRGDAFKMCFVYQRPFGERVSNIGMWLNTMEVMGLIAILVNCALIGLSGQVHRMFPDISKTQTILLIVALEHVMLLIRFLISCVIPDKPDWVVTEMAKVEFARREAVNRLSSATITPPSSSGNAERTLPLLPLQRSPPADSSRTGRKKSWASWSSLRLSDGDSDDSDKFEVASTEIPKSPVAVENATVAVETDFSQSIDNIDRILKDIDKTPHEEMIALEATTPQYTSESSSDYELLAPKTKGELSSNPTVNKEWGNFNSRFRAYRDSICHSNASKKKKQLGMHRSVACIPSDTAKFSQPQCDSISSNESLLSHSPPPPPTSASLASVANIESTTAQTVNDPDEKKKRLRSALIRRARSVAVFSLKLKERRAKNDLKIVDKPRESTNTNDAPSNPNITVGGELSCVPIEMLISIDDANNARIGQTRNSTAHRSKISSTTMGSRL